MIKIIKILLTFLILILFNNHIYAQIDIDSLINKKLINKYSSAEIYKYRVDTQTYHYCRIYKKAIQQELQKGNINNLEKLLSKEYIVEYNPERDLFDTIVLYNNHQRTLLFLITENYKEIIDDLINDKYSFYKFRKGTFTGSYKWNKNYNYRSSYNPVDFQLTDSLEHYLINNIEFYNNSIAHSDLTEDYQEFMKLYTMTTGYNGDYCEKSDTILSKSHYFLTSCSNMTLKNYVNKNIYLNYKPTKWSFAGSILGSGINIFTGELSQYYKPSVYISLYLWVDFSYDKIYFSSSFSGTIATKIKKDIIHETGIWPKDSSNFQIIGDLTLGYSIIDNKKWRISPYIGLMLDNHVQNYETDDDNPENSSFINNQYVTYGLMIDKAFEGIDCFPTIIGFKSKNINYVRFKIGYLNPKYRFDDKTIKGGMLYFQCSMIMRNFRQKRIKYNDSE